MRRGINDLTVEWPALPEVGAAAMAEAVIRLERGLVADAHPVFGELFSLQAAAL